MRLVVFCSNDFMLLKLGISKFGLGVGRISIAVSTA